MSEMVRSFSELTPEQQPVAGGKGGTLARLYQGGYAVPDGFVILPTAFAGDELRPGAWTQVQAHLARMRDKDEEMAFAVRSSALSEDSPFASFAGEFETVLDVHSDEMIRTAIYTVRRSRHSERVRAYSEARGVDVVHDMAVVVQQLIRADISGVLFTANPVSGSRSEMMGNFVYGFGEELVSGEAEPYTFTLKLPRGQYDGPDELRGFARKLYKLAARLEKELGCPQDIEWTIAEGKLYLLQSRPVTTLLEYDPVTYDWNSSFTGDYLWGDTGGIYPDVQTPSTWSVWTIVSGRTLAGIRFMGNIGGRLYVNYSLLYSMLRKLGRSHQNTVDSLMLMMGQVPSGAEIPMVPLSLRGVLAQGDIRLLLKQRRLKKQFSETIAAASEQCRRLRREILETQERAGLITLWHEQVRPLLWDLFLLQDVINEDYTFPFTSLRKEILKLLGEADGNALFSTLSGASQRTASVGISAGLYKVLRGEMSREAYMEQFGHRHASENELTVPRPMEDPGWLDRRLAELERNPLDVQELLERRAAEFDAAWGEFEKRFPSKAKPIRKKIDKMAEATQRREAIRSELTRSLGVIRAWFLRAGELTGLGDGIFFLTYEEVLDVLAGDDSSAAHIPVRRETYEKYKALPPYPAWIRGRFDPVQWASDPNRRSDRFDSHSPVPEPETPSDMIQGIPGSAGQVEGTVRLIHSPEEGDQFRPGEILLASTTNIGWTLLFPRAAAVITDVGAPLAHAAVVARELGIPAVVGCGNATMRLKTGDRVRVDGGRGVVEILDVG